MRKRAFLSWYSIHTKSPDCTFRAIPDKSAAALLMLLARAFCAKAAPVPPGYLYSKFHLHPGLSTMFDHDTHSGSPASAVKVILCLAWEGSDIRLAPRMSWSRRRRRCPCMCPCRLGL